eukprot:6798480-Pyramimonas_sp.AAC.1
MGPGATDSCPMEVPPETRRRRPRGKQKTVKRPTPEGEQPQRGGGPDEGRARGGSSWRQGRGRDVGE